MEALDPAVALGMPRLDQAVHNGVLSATLLEGMMTGGFALSGRAEAVAELLAVVSEHLVTFYEYIRLSYHSTPQATGN